MDERLRVLLVARDAAEGLGADEVVRLAELGGAVAYARHRRRLALAAVAAHDVERVALVEVELGDVLRSDRADVLQGHCDALFGADVQRQTLAVVRQAIAEAELERQ